ncbi:RNA-directed DNA polymerase (Reverse transcriptase) [Solwaraspora sp. WMMB335]|uniref:RNA-directed DNA polymerase (Reverse transcriptase) n=1 Tax=Solwaraspora sp. WMMB335 TaxID=3404118 RepID=UPI003B943813
MSAATAGQAGRHPAAHTLMPLVTDPVRLKNCARALMRHRGSPGSDGIRWTQYRRDLDRRIANLATRLSAGTWAPAPARHVVLPSWGKDIALAIPTVEDRIVHRALREAAELILCADAYPDWMYGWRPRAGRVDALHAAASHLTAGRNWVADLDVAATTRDADLNSLVDGLACWISDGTFLALVRTVLENLPTPLAPGSGLTPMLTNIRLLPVDERLRDLPVIRVTDNYTVFCLDRAHAELHAARVADALSAQGLRPSPTKSHVWQPNPEDLYLAG